MIAPNQLNYRSQKESVNNKMIYFLILFLFSSLQTNALKHISDAETDYFKKGMEQKKKGEVKAALNIWLSARSNLTKDEIDPRIGFAFIELVTEERLTHLYKTGTLMYYWALSGNTIQPFQKEFQYEIQRISPLLSKRELREWEKLLKANDPLLLNMIHIFWRQLDLTIESIHNERLLEHWERIHFVREHFNENERLVYPSDQRGSVYIKYGYPDRTKKGTFRFNSLRIQAWAQDMAMLNTPGQGIISDTSSSSPSIISNIRSGSVSTANMTEQARKYFTRPRYEIWVYERYKNEQTGDNLLFIFGDDAGSGEFELLNALEDVIPSRAFNPSIGRSANPTVTPGILLQMLFYDQVAATDSFFGNTLIDIESEALSSTDANPYLGSSMASKNSFELSRIQTQALRHASSYAEHIQPLEMEVHQYRILDKNYTPYLLTYVYSSPINLILSNYAGNSGGTSEKFSIRHTAQLRDRAWELLANISDQPEMVFSSNVKSTQSLFLLPNNGNDTKQLFSSALYSNKPAGDTNDETTMFDPLLIGLGKVEIAMPAPLSSDPGRLEMSDIILGYDDTIKTDRIPFYVPKNKHIPSEKNLKLHFEAYRINMDSSGVAKFSIAYKITPGRRPGILNGKEPEVSLRLNYETGEPYAVENLEIETRELRAGRYKLTLVLTDSTTNQQVERSVEFRIIKE